MAIRREAAFTREWLDRLFKSLSDGDVLVGGQALVFWAGWFGLIGEDNPDITKDADILGGFDSVAAIARALNGKAERIFSGQDGMECLSAGLDSDAANPQPSRRPRG